MKNTSLNILKSLFLIAALAIILATVFGSGVAMAQTPTGSSAVNISIPLQEGAKGQLATPVKIIILVTLLTLAPSLLISVTSFTRIVVVFAFLRQAMGLQSSPPNQVMVGLALFLTFAIMSPVFHDMYATGVEPYMNGQLEEKVAMQQTIEPLRKFMYAQTRTDDLRLMLDIAQIKSVETFEELPTSALIPAYIISELKTAFQIGFMIYIPFVVIDMIVSMVLLAMGMMVLPPVVISLPFKVMLFVIVDGWDLIIASLVKSFR